MLIFRVSVFCLIIAVSSCGKDAEIELNRVDYIGNELKVNGYYISPRHSDEVISTYFFYRSGVVLYGGGYPRERSIEEIENGWLSDSFNDGIKNTKSFWGLFNISGTSLEYETWEAGNGGVLKTVVRSCEILDNSTFVVTSLFNNYTDKTVMLNDTFYFEQFSPKPDSTNMFIP